jgi:glutamyl-tRNA synthetase
VQKSGAKFDEQRLTWINGYFIRHMQLDDLYKKTKDFWPDEAKDANESYKKAVLKLISERLKYFAEIPELTSSSLKIWQLMSA